MKRSSFVKMTYLNKILPVFVLILILLIVSKENIVFAKESLSPLGIRTEDGTEILLKEPYSINLKDDVLIYLKSNGDCRRYEYILNTSTCLNEGDYITFPRDGILTGLKGEASGTKKYLKLRGYDEAKNKIYESPVYEFIYDPILPQIMIGKDLLSYNEENTVRIYLKDAESGIKHIEVSEGPRLLYRELIPAFKGEKELFLPLDKNNTDYKLKLTVTDGAGNQKSVEKKIYKRFHDPIAVLLFLSFIITEAILPLAQKVLRLGYSIQAGRRP